MVLTKYFYFFLGPPQAEQKEMKKIGRIGENVRLVCPIGGFPAPMVEWSKNGEKIDYMWERHRTGRKSLKIRNANEDDTGVFTCKGINGFGSEEVRIELIIVGKFQGINYKLKLSYSLIQPNNKITLKQLSYLYLLVIKY